MQELERQDRFSGTLEELQRALVDAFRHERARRPHQTSYSKDTIGPQPQNYTSPPLPLFNGDLHLPRA